MPDDLSHTHAAQRIAAYWTDDSVEPWLPTQRFELVPTWSARRAGLWWFSFEGTAGR